MRVLVLCHGNINRSAFCAALIRRERPGWDVQSAGLHTRAGRPASSKAKRAAAERGMSLAEHRSQPVTWDLVLEADRTLYMDGGNEKRLKGLIYTCGYRSNRADDVWARCELLARYGSLRRLADPNYTSDPDLLAEMWAAQEFCVSKFLEVHP